MFDISLSHEQNGSWHCGLEAFAIAALDLEMKERAVEPPHGRCSDS